jgi:hypothetical protein
MGVKMAGVVRRGAMNIGLVSCSKTKQSVAAPARYLYTSELFKKASAYFEATYDRWFILSALHSLVEPSQVIEPYDKTLKRMSGKERKEWASSVLRQIQAAGLQNEMFYFHAGDTYRQHLEQALRSDVPLRGLGIGQQLGWYASRSAAEKAPSSRVRASHEQYVRALERADARLGTLFGRTSRGY